MPVQSANNRIIKLMNRRYDIYDVIQAIKSINQEFPYIEIHSQFIVGSPTETEEEFNDNLKISRSGKDKSKMANSSYFV
jgi:tRNA-2-methylthio-N6-dimethylallyladenosine synthase